jgi:3-oxoacyl-[acyl-carrier protein] reductase
MSEADWDAVLGVNLKGAFNCTRAVSKIMMKQRDGRIVNMASIIGIMGNAGQANYAASKGGLIAFTKTTSTFLFFGKAANWKNSSFIIFFPSLHC